MPTAKKTTTKKTPAKKTPVKKEEVKVEEPVVEEAVEEEVPYEIASEKGTLKHMREGEFVKIIFPYDPTHSSDDQYFEHNVNGINFRYKRGEVVKVPKDLAETFERKEKMRTRMDIIYKDFEGNGKKLNY